MTFLALVAGVDLVAFAGPEDGIHLLVTHGAQPGDVDLEWTGGQPPFDVFRSADPAIVGEPGSILGSTLNLRWSDSPPDGPIWYYMITSSCDPLIDRDLDGFSECDDCHDGDGRIHPGAVEHCNGVDDDCDGTVDNGHDADGDGFSPCHPDPVFADCDDGDATVHPGAPETCGPAGSGNGVDEDCNGYVDETCDPCDPADADGDGFSECDGDCEPLDVEIHPGAPEQCDGKDNDCNRRTVKNCGPDEPCPEAGLGADVCRDELLCSCVVNAAGGCSGSYSCQGFCNTSQTTAFGDGCSDRSACLADLLHSANVNACLAGTEAVGPKQAGAVCGLNSECRSGTCARFCVGPGCGQTYCLDHCSSDAYCPVAGTVCAITRGSAALDSRCEPTSLPTNGSLVVGQACLTDGSCDHGFCATDAGARYCTETCCTDSDCPSGFTCSLRGDQIDTGITYAEPGAPSCSLDSDCPAAMICNPTLNLCVWRLSATAPMCLLDAVGQGGRTAGQVCLDNSECRSNFCDKERGVCVETCCNDAGCPDGMACRLQFIRTIPGFVTRARICTTVRTEQVILPH